MNADSSFLSVQVIVWTCVILFVATSMTTFLALVGKVRLGGGDGSHHHYYLKQLFVALVVEVVGISMAVYAAYVGLPEGQLAKIENQPPVSVPIKPSNPNPGVSIARENIRAKVYATSDGPQVEKKTIDVPLGWKYVTHSVNVWTKAGRSNYTATPVVDQSTGRVKAVTVSVTAGKQEIFGPRSWIGVDLVVTIEKSS